MQMCCWYFAYFLYFSGPFAAAVRRTGHHENVWACYSQRQPVNTLDKPEVLWQRKLKMPNRQKKFYGFDSCCALHQCYYFQLLCYVNKLLPSFMMLLHHV